MRAGSKVDTSRQHDFCDTHFFIAAGKAFMEAANLQINLQSKHEAGQRYVDAGNCFKKTDVEGKFKFSFIKGAMSHKFV